MKRTFWRSNYLLINNLFIHSTLQFSLYVATGILVVANVLSHEEATIAIWHQISTYLLYSLMRHSSHCSIYFCLWKIKHNMCVKRCNSIILAIHLSNGRSGCLLLRLHSCDAGDISSGKLFGLEVITNE